MSHVLAQIAGHTTEWAGVTSIHPVGLSMLIVLACFVFALPRAWALAPLLILACFVPSGQRIVLAGFDFSFLRILVIAYWLRIFIRSDYRGIRVIAMDYAVAAWILVGSFVYVIQWMESSALVNRSGYIYESLGIYVTLRCMLRGWADVDRTVLVLALLAIPVSCFFILEKSTGRNLFSLMGGVPEITQVREGRLRAQGAFSHPILAGCFWAVVLTLCGGMVLGRRRGALMLTSLICCVFIVIACASSTPLMAMIAAFMGLALGFARPVLRWLQIATPFVLVTLHFMMEGPVWALIARISAVGGSTGWHRKHLIDKAVEFFPEWFLIGTKSTSHWGRGLQDVTNQYILEGVRGGFITLALFIAVIWLAFRGVGIGLRGVPSRGLRFWLTWAIGVSLATHCLNFIGVSYFGQTTVSWFLSLALAATAQELALPNQRKLPNASPHPKSHARRGQLQHP